MPVSWIPLSAPFPGLKPAEDRMTIFRFLPKFQQPKKNLPIKGATASPDSCLLAWLMSAGVQKLLQGTHEDQRLLSKSLTSKYLLAVIWRDKEKSWPQHLTTLLWCYECAPFAISVTGDINRILQCLQKGGFQTQIARSNSTWIRQKENSQEGGITRKTALVEADVQREQAL